MDANTFFTLAIAALVIPTVAYDQIKKRLFPKQLDAPQTDAPQTDAPAPAGSVLPTRRWLDYVNAQPQTVPHLAVIGPSGAGKTTLVTAVLSDRQGQIVVITAKEGDSWGGLPYVGIDDDATYTTAQRTFSALDAEVKRRLVAAKHHRLTADWMTIVVDDFSTLVKEAPIAAEVVKLVARLGRSLRVRLIMLSDSALVKAIGLEGEGETRSNFAFIRLARGHRGGLEVEGTPTPIDTSMADEMATRAQLSSRAWHAPRDAEAELNDYLDTGIGGENEADTAGIRYQYQSVSAGMDAVSAGINLSARDTAIMAILTANPSASKNDIYSAVGGNRNIIFARIDVLRGML